MTEVEDTQKWKFNQLRFQQLDRNSFPKNITWTDDQTSLQSLVDFVDFWNASREKLIDTEGYTVSECYTVLVRPVRPTLERRELGTWNLVVSPAMNQGLIGARASRVCMFVLFQDASDLRAFGDVLMSPVRLLSLSTTISSRVFGNLGAEGTF